MIEIENLCFSYDKENNSEYVLDNINLKIDDGEFVAILGRNGSGKSTLAKHINAICLPDKGKVTINGMCTFDETKIWDIRSNAAMVFQNPDNQIVATIVEDDVAFAAENLSIPSEEIQNRVDYALKAVGMEEYKKYAPHLLSGGQKQRIAIAGVVAMQPKIIIFDEPTAMLDPVGRKEVMDIICKLNSEYHITILLITHNMEEAALAQRIVVMDKGKIALDDNPRNIFSNIEQILKIGLDVPQMTYLAYLLIQNGIDIRPDILTVDECVEEIKKQCQ